MAVADTVVAVRAPAFTELAVTAPAPILAADSDESDRALAEIDEAVILTVLRDAEVTAPENDPTPPCSDVTCSSGVVALAAARMLVVSSALTRHCG